jgi:hypothetical protein
MGDVDHRGSGPNDSANAFEKHFGRILIERGGGLIKQQHLWLDRQGLGDLEQVLLCDR